MRHILLALLVTAGFAAPLAAQATDSIPELGEIVVTADRSPTPLGKVVSATTVITGEELRSRGVFFLEDALREVPGGAVVPTGSYGGVSSFFLRGGESDYVKVLIDGVPVNQSGGAFNFGTLSTDNIDRIEVVRGPVSVLYGSDAVTGVVQVFTKRGMGPLRAEVSSQAGSFATWRGLVGVSGGGDEVSYSASLSRYRTDGIYAFNSGYRSTVGSGALTVHPDPKTDVTLSAHTDDNTTHFPTNSAGVPVDSNQQSSETGTTLGLELGRRFSERAELRVFLASHSEVDGSDNQPDFPADTFGFFSSQSQSRFLRRSLDARGILQLTPRVRVTAGGQAEFEDLNEFDRSASNFDTIVTVSSTPPFSASRRDVGAYGQTVVELGKRSLVNVGIRLDDNQGFGTHFTYRAGVVYALPAGLRVRGSIGSAFKEPSIRENYANAPFEVGNPNLKPEQSRSWEVGLEQTLANGTVVLAANYFDQRFRNLIQYDGSAAPGQPTYQNVGAATSRGVEVVVDVRPSRGTALTASYTWLRTRVVDPGFELGAGDVFAAGQPLIRRPEHSARVDGRTRIAERLALGLGVNYVGRRWDVDFTPFPSIRTTLPAYLTVDADASVELLRDRPGQVGVTGMIRAENLLDKNYQTVVGFAGRPRAVLAGLTLGI